MQGDLDSLEEWSHKTSSSITRPSTRRSCGWARANPNINTGKGVKGLRLEKDVSVLMIKNTVQLHWRIWDQVVWGFEHPDMVNAVHVYSNKEMTRQSSKVSFNPTYLWFYNPLSLWLYLQEHNKVCIAAQCLLNTHELWKSWNCFILVRRWEDKCKLIIWLKVGKQHIYFNIHK